MYKFVVLCVSPNIDIYIYIYILFSYGENFQINLFKESVHIALCFNDQPIFNKVFIYISLYIKNNNKKDNLEVVKTSKWGPQNRYLIWKLFLIVMIFWKIAKNIVGSNKEKRTLISNAYMLVEQVSYALQDGKHQIKTAIATKDHYILFY